jgi:hypothetical protein
VHLSWVADLGSSWDETDFHETRDTGFLLARLEEIWKRVPRTKPLSVGVVLLDVVPAVQHQPDLFAADTDRINDCYGRCAIGVRMTFSARARLATSPPGAVKQRWPISL